MNESFVSRREFLKLSAKMAALVTAIRAGFSGKPVQAGESLGANVDREKPLSKEVQRALDQMTIVDIGEVKQGKVMSLSLEKTWELLTGERQPLDEIRQLVENPLAMSPLQRVSANFLKYSGHGQSVVDALQDGISTLIGKSSAKISPDFSPIEFSPESALIGEVVKEEDFYSHSRMTKGSRYAVRIGQPDLGSDQLQSARKIVSCSFQTGTLEMDLSEEAGERANLVLSTDDVIALVNGFSSSKERIGISPAQPRPEFLLSQATKISDIRTITVSTAGEDTSREYIFDLDKWGDQESIGNTVTTIDPNAQEISIELTLVEGQVVSGKQEILPEDYAYNYEPSEVLMRRSPESMRGAYSPENQHKQENLAALDEFLRQNPDRFFVMALGNYGDSMTDDDLKKLPNNVLFVGQASFSEMGQSYSTYGGTSGSVDNIFVNTSDLSIIGDSSSLATPNAAFVISYLMGDIAAGERISRPQVLAKLRNAGCLSTVSVRKGQTMETYEITLLDTERLKAVVSDNRGDNKLPSRRDILRGKLLRE